MPSEAAEEKKSLLSNRRVDQVGLCTTDLGSKWFAVKLSRGMLSTQWHWASLQTARVCEQRKQIVSALLTIHTLNRKNGSVSKCLYVAARLAFVYRFNMDFLVTLLLTSLHWSTGVQSDYHARYIKLDQISTYYIALKSLQYNQNLEIFGCFAYLLFYC